MIFQLTKKICSGSRILLPIALLIGLQGLGCVTAHTRTPFRLQYELAGVAPDMRLGSSVAAIGDVNGDGSPDILAGAPLAQSTHNLVTGAIFVYNGRDGALIRRIDGLNAPDTLGTSVAPIADINGDTVPDILAGAPNAQPNGQYGLGSVFVFSGATGEELLRIDGWMKGHYMGVSVADLGDINGDLIPDFAVGASRESAERSRISFVHVFSGADGSELYHVSGYIAGDYFGRELAVIGDVDGDRVNDFCVGIIRSHPYDRALAGSISVFSGASGKILYGIFGTSEAERLGGSVSAAGDVNNDGVPDILAGAHTRSTSESRFAGSTYVFSGVDGSEILRIDGPSPSYLLGRAVAGVGDVNGDEVPDFLVGATGNEEHLPQSSGRAFVFSGADGSEIFRVEGSFKEEILGSVIGSAGDIDGNGSNDLLIAAPMGPGDGMRQSGRILVFTSHPQPATSRKQIMSPTEHRFARRTSASTP